MERLSSAAEAKIREASSVGAKHNPPNETANMELKPPVLNLEDFDLQGILDRSAAENELEQKLAELNFENLTLLEQENTLRSLFREFEVRWKIGNEDINHFRHLAEVVGKKLDSILALKIYLEKSKTVGQKLTVT